MRSRCRHQIAYAYERTQQSSLLRLRPQPLRWPHAQQRRFATAVDEHNGSNAQHPSRSLAIASAARHNEIGVQQVSAHIHSQIFRDPASKIAPPDAELIALAKNHLARHELLGKVSDKSEPIGFDLPDLQGSSMDEHFYKVGMAAAEPYLSMARDFSKASAPAMPRKWVKRSGWTKYHADGTSEPVDYPDADVLSFDVEVMWHETNFAAMACAVSATNWYAWISPWLLKETEDDRQLIPLGNPKTPRIIIGHNIGYDRARIAEEYSLEQSANFFVDTMSLHVAVNGMCSRQRPTWQKHRKEQESQDEIAAAEQNGDLGALLGESMASEEEADLWVGRSSTNSLRNVAEFHCGIKMDKTRREWFGELDRAGIVERLDEMLEYCATDVDITHQVYKKVFPFFLETCPHPVSFAAMRHLSSEILPINRSWDAYIANAEATYNTLLTGVQERLVDLAEKALAQREHPEHYEKDAWLSQLNWGGQEIRMVKGKKKGDPPRPAARQKMPGMPNWYKDLFPKADADIALTVRTRIAPLLLKMSWDGHPLIWSDVFGWTFRVPIADAAKYQKLSMTQCDMYEEENFTLRDDQENVYFKLPHKDGPKARCANPMAKGYLGFFEKGTLSSEYEYAKEALEMNASCSYWISARDRIRSQMAVYHDDPAVPKEHQVGFILPQVVPMGTVTRRAVENTWMTAANAKKNRVGSELKSIITAPPGYCFVGADVDSEELWIASVVGDANFKLHGGNAIGFMTLEGTKAAGTDLHSRTANILGISRNDAKIFNYGRIYGAGLTFAQSLLRQFNPTISEEEAARVAGNLYQETKGKKVGSKFIRERKFWRGGTESLVFNRLEDFAEQERPRTPVLGAGITEALMRQFISKKGDFMTSRINWAIQSSGVDYLHLLIVSMEYLCRRYNIAARVALTVHDEIRYLAPEHDKYRCAMALQVANLWTRAMFSQQIGINDLPQSCAYFSAVDIDHVLRKEVDMDCVTPSHPTKIAPGESLDITTLLAKGDRAYLDPKILPVSPLHPQRYSYTYRRPVMEDLQIANPVPYLRAQIASTPAELADIVKSIRAPTTKPFSDEMKSGTSSSVSSKSPKPTTGRPRKTSAAKKEKTSTSTTTTKKKEKAAATTTPPTITTTTTTTPFMKNTNPLSAHRQLNYQKTNNFFKLYDNANQDHQLSRTWGNTSVSVGLIRRLPAGQAATVR